MLLCVLYKLITIQWRTTVLLYVVRDSERKGEREAKERERERKREREAERERERQRSRGIVPILLHRIVINL